jgi:prevent-host-death family protein
MQITNISEAKASLSRLIEEVQVGKQVIIGKAGKPVAVLSAYVADETPRRLGGSWEGKVEVADDFDNSCPELEDAFYNSQLFPDER